MSNITDESIMKELTDLGVTMQNNHREVCVRLESLEKSDKEQWDRIGNSTPPTVNGAANGDASLVTVYADGFDKKSLNHRVTGHDHDIASTKAEVIEVKQEVATVKRILENQNRFMGLDLVGNTKSLTKFLASREGAKTVGGLLIVAGVIYQTLRGWGWVH